MRRTGRYFFLELKKALLCLPRLFVYCALFGLLSAALAALLAGQLYGGETISVAAVAVVSEEESGYTDFLLDYAGRLESASGFFDFREMEDEEARRALAEGKVAAVIKIPEHTIEGILTGNNLPVRVAFADAGSLADALLSELTRAGASILGSAQAGIYAVSDLNSAYELNLDLTQVFAQLDRTNLQYALMRQALFMQETVSASGAVSPSVYYAAGAVVLLFLASGAALHILFTHESPAFLAVLSHQGISAPSQTAAKLCVLFLANCCLLPPLFAAVRLLPEAADISPGVFLLQALPLVLFLSTYELFFYYWCRRPAEGLLWLCVSSVLLLFLSGCFLPSAFLPAPLVRAASLTAFPWARKAAEGLFTGVFMKKAALLLLLHAFVCFLLDAAACSQKRRRLS